MSGPTLLAGTTKSPDPGPVHLLQDFIGQQSDGALEKGASRVMNLVPQFPVQVHGLRLLHDSRSFKTPAPHELGRFAFRSPSCASACTRRDASQRRSLLQEAPPARSIGIHYLSPATGCTAKFPSYVYPLKMTASGDCRVDPSRAGSNIGPHLPGFLPWNRG